MRSPRSPRNDAASSSDSRARSGVNRHSRFRRRSRASGADRPLVTREGVLLRPTDSFGLLRAEDDPARIEVLGVGFVCRAAEHVDHAAHPHITEAGGSNDVRVLPNEECSSDSTRPEVDIGDRILRKRFLHYDISNLQPPARLEHSIDFPKDRSLVWAQVDHAI